MSNLKSLFSKALLAVALATGAGIASAGPTYHVSLDTTSFSGDGFLELTFLGLGNAAPATATLSNFTGAYGSVVDVSGPVSGSTDDTITFSNSDLNDLFQAITLGALFGFDVNFDVDGSMGAGSSLAVMLAGADSYLTESPAVRIELVPGGDPVITAVAGIGSVTQAVADVPEPSDWAMLLTGLGLMGFTLRRRQR